MKLGEETGNYSCSVNSEKVIPSDKSPQSF